MRTELEKQLDEQFPFARDAEKPRRHHHEKNTCLRQLNGISRAFRSIMHRKEEGDNLHDSYRPFLRHLGHYDGCTQLDLVHATGLRAPTVSVTLAKMEKDGLITRVSDDYDLRSRRVYITDKFSVINLNTRGAIADIENKIMKDISEEDAAVTLRTLEKMYSNLKEEFTDRK